MDFVYEHLLCGGDYADCSIGLELDLAGDKSEKGSIPAYADIPAWFKTQASLLQYDAACRYSLAFIALYAERFRLAVSSVDYVSHSCLSIYGLVVSR